MRDPVALLQTLEGDQRLRGAQFRLPAAGNELLGLCEEFDFTDAAATDFDVVAGDADRAEAAKGMDLSFHSMNVGDGGEVEVFTPDEGRQILHQGGGRGEVACHRARLDQRPRAPSFGRSSRSS